MSTHRMLKCKSRGLLPPIQNPDPSSLHQLYLIDESVSSNHQPKDFQRFNTRRETEFILPADPFFDKHDIFPPGLSKVKSPDFRRINTRRETELVMPSDPFLDKFEKISWKLGNMIDKGESKYSEKKNEVKPICPRIINDDLTKDSDKMPLKDPVSRRPTLNKHKIRSQIFESTSKWLSPRAVSKKRKVF